MGSSSLTPKVAGQTATDQCTSFVRETNVPKVFTYYHVEIDDHSLIMTENTPAETFVDNVDRLNFDNWAEHEALYPEGRPIAELPYPRAKSHRQVPVSTRVTLGARGPGHWCYRQLSCRWSKKAAFDGRLRFWVASTPRTQRP